MNIIIGTWTQLVVTANRCATVPPLHMCVVPSMIALPDHRPCTLVYSQSAHQNHHVGFKQKRKAYIYSLILFCLIVRVLYRWKQQLNEWVLGSMTAGSQWLCAGFAYSFRWQWYGIPERKENACCWSTVYSIVFLCLSVFQCARNLCQGLTSSKCWQVGTWPIEWFVISPCITG